MHIYIYIIYIFIYIYIFRPRNYKEISENTLSKRFADHKRSFNIIRYKNDTRLSVEYWNVKAGNSNLKVT